MKSQQSGSIELVVMGLLAALVVVLAVPLAQNIRSPQTASIAEASLPVIKAVNH